MDFDITNLVGDPQLLRSLAQEFRQLKASQADVDFNAWMRTRLREARLRKNTDFASTECAATPPDSMQEQQKDHREEGEQQQPSTQPPAVQTSASTKPAVATTGLVIVRKPQRHSLRHKGAIPAVTNLRPSRKASDLDGRLASSQPGLPAQPAPQPHVSMATATDIVAPAAPSVTPLLHAASEHERLIALSSALAQQHVSLGISSMPPPPSKGPAVVENPAIEQLTQQQAQLVQLVQATQQQLQEHKELLVAMMKPAGTSNSQQAPADPAQLQTATTAADAAEQQAVATQAAALSAWFIPQAPPTAAKTSTGGDVPEKAAVTPRAVLPGGDETLRVVHVCSPTGQLRKPRQQRKAELKSTLKQVLTKMADPATDGDMLPGLGSDLGLSGRSDKRHASTHEAGQKTAVRRILGDLLHRTQLQQEPQQLQPPHQAPGTHSFYYGPQEVAGVEEAAALALQRDIQTAQEHSRTSRIAQLEAAVQQLQQQSQQLSSRPSPPAATCSSTLTDPTTAALRQAGHLLRANMAMQTETSDSMVGSGGEVNVTAEGEGVAHPGITLHRMLAQLQRLEVAEAQLRRKWLLDGSSSNTTPYSPPPVAVPVGAEVVSSTVSAANQHANTSPPLQQTATRAASHSAAPSGLQTFTNAAPGDLQLQNTPQSTSAQALVQEAVTAATVDEVQDGRRRFLAAQAHSDGMLMSRVEGGWVAPQDIVEDIADALLDELLEQQATDMLSLCDVLGEQLLQEELQ